MKGADKLLNLVRIFKILTKYQEQEMETLFPCVHAGISKYEST